MTLCGGRRGLPSFPTRRSSDLSRPASAGCECASMKPGTIVFPVKSSLRAPGPARFSTLVNLAGPAAGSEEHTSDLQSHSDLVCRLLLDKKKPLPSDLVDVHSLA